MAGTGQSCAVGRPRWSPCSDRGVGGGPCSLAQVACAWGLPRPEPALRAVAAVSRA